MERSPTSGVKVFGSAVLRVDPDVASLRFAVSRQAKFPKDAFQQTHEGVRNVRAFLARAGAAGDVATSRVTLSRTFEYVNSRQQPTGYSARVAFNVLLADLAAIEEVLIGVVDAGANEVEAVEFRTTRLKEHRAEARRRAVAAGHEKAHVYCSAAGVRLGAVTAIEDMNPDDLHGTGEGHTTRESAADDGGLERALSPGSITVGAAVSLMFELAAGSEPDFVDGRTAAPICE